MRHCSFGLSSLAPAYCPQISEMPKQRSVASFIGLTRVAAFYG